MIKAKELCVGLFIWWKASTRKSAGWSCPCVVTEVGQSSYRLMAFDDFTVLDALRLPEHPDDSTEAMQEMRVCTQEEVERYLEDHKLELIDEASAAQRVYEDKSDVYAAYLENSSRFLAELPESEK